MMVGIPALALTAVALWLVAGFVVDYAFTGQIPVSVGVRGVIGFACLILGMGFMISYAVAYYSRRPPRGKKALDSAGSTGNPMPKATS
jgi:hypothetical protein